MGYTTDFEGSVTVEPPLNVHEIAYLRKFAQTRRMARTLGPYHVDGLGSFGQGQDADVLNYNQPPEEQPGLWCDWEPTEDGTGIEWNGTEKFYNSVEWMRYLIDTFLKPSATVRNAATEERHLGWFYPAEFAHFTFDHVVNGTIAAQGEDPDDTWRLVVTDNVVTQECV